MERVSENAAKFNRTLAQVAERLAAHDVVVSTLHADWSSFGCWELEVQRGSDAERYYEAARLDPENAIPPDVIRCVWDGREGCLMIEASPTRPLSAPNEWRKEHAQAFDSFEEAVRFAENYLHQKFLV